MQAAHTFQIAVLDDGEWLRDYVCATDRVAAVQQFLEEHPPWTLDFLLMCDDFQVERCD